MDERMMKKNTAPQEREAVLRQKYAERTHHSGERFIMRGQTNGLRLSVNTLRKLDAQRPKRTKCNSPARRNLANRTRAFMRNYANTNCITTVRFLLTEKANQLAELSREASDIVNSFSGELLN